jgi:hypothetical protein
MDDHLLLILLTIFVLVAAVALFAQAVAFVGLLFVARDVRRKVTAVWPEVEAIIGSSRRTADKAEKHIAAIGASSVAILEVTKQQLTKVDELLTDASTRAKVQMERAEMVMDDTMTRVQHGFRASDARIPSDRGSCHVRRRDVYLADAACARAGSVSRF